jgi:hypothetical protein
MPRIRPFALSFLIFFLFSPQIVPQIPAPPQSNSAPTAANNPQVKPVQVNCTNNSTYVNNRGETVKRPETCSNAPTGATAQCRDGYYSFSKNHRGTCSHHGGVAKWL